MDRQGYIDPEETYHPQDAIGETIKAAGLMGGAGFAISAIQNSLSRHNIGALGVFTRFGSSIGYFALVGGAYTFTTLATSNLRRKNDTWNTAVGGFVGGACLGLRGSGLPAVLGYGAATSVILSAYEYTGGSLMGAGRDPEVDEFERKQQLRRNRRRPIEETVAELGEGRGIYAPGYPERRAQRIKENYGIDVNTSPSQSA